jgi:hypothetical protein
VVQVKQDLVEQEQLIGKQDLLKLQLSQQQTEKVILQTLQVELLI